MAEWTNNPTKTGAYWEQIKGLEPDIVWIHNGRIFPVIKSVFPELTSVEHCVEQGMMFYGPLDSPPPMPSEK